ncbi:MAG: CBS domain-containing protein [Oligoflexia bacterium]|nr:CBS domain-containing protein [Oligoflexia bacterium]
MVKSVHEIMSLNPVSVGPTATLREVRDKMAEFEVRHIPVVDENELIGIISDRDLGRILLAPLESEEEALEKRLDQPVSRHMSSDVISIDTESEIGDAIDLMVEYKVGAIPVVDGENGRLRGIVSYIDVLRASRELFL